MKKTLPTIKTEEATISNMNKAIDKLNSQSIVLISQASFRKYCYEVISQMVLQNIKIPIKIQLR